MSKQENTKAVENGLKAPLFWGWHTYLSAALALAILLGLAAMLDLKEVWLEIRAADKSLLILAALAHYMTYPIRGLRWRRCLNRWQPEGGAWRFGLLVFFYNFVDNLVPAKLGDVYGAHLARINCGIPRSAALGSIVFLRVVDGWTVLLLASLASWLLFSDTLLPAIVWSLTAGGIVALAATSVMLLFFLFKRSAPRWLPERAHRIIHAFRMGMWPQPKEIVPIFLSTVPIWALETLWTFLLALAFGLKLSPAEAVFLTMIPLLASAFPLTPAGVGVVEVTLFGCLRVLGVPAPLAASITIVNRFADYWLHIGLGLVVWSIRQTLGLRTWREVPLEGLQGSESSQTALRREIFHES